MSKICTSIEQSQKLIELGIDVNTADMMWDDWNLIDGEWHIFLDYYPEIEQDYGRKCYPAWSLSALLCLMPNVNGHYPELCRGKQTGLYYMWIEDTFDTQTFDNPTDAAFEMICWLKENKKL